MQIHVPALLRIKPGIIGQLGKYLARERFHSVVLLYGEGIKPLFGNAIIRSCDENKVVVLQDLEISDQAVEKVFDALVQLPSQTVAIVAVGGGKVVDFGKYLGFLKRLPVVAIPTALSNDGMASPTASLLVKGVRNSLKARSPYGVIIDTQVVLSSPVRYTYSGIGDMISKLTAIHDWKRAFHETKEPVNDFSVLVAQQSVEAVLSAADHASESEPIVKDTTFISKLAGSLVMSGVAMEICGSSRPASGAEHLISHAYDRVSAVPHLHGVQVGVATYAVSWLQKNPLQEKISHFFDQTGFWKFVSQYPLCRKDFEAAIHLAPTLRSNYYTVLQQKGAVDFLIEFTRENEFLKSVLK